MGRRRMDHGNGNGNEEENQNQDQDGFFACYLLCSLCPRYKPRTTTYIGFTVDPKRRIRQHNGHITCGAWRTKKARPWEMVLCIYGFPSNITALQFEWAWQHPTKSLAVRKAASNFKSLQGVANKIKLAYTMLNLPTWDNLNLTVNFFSTKYAKFTADCPKLPSQMKFNICEMDELPCYSGDSFSHGNDESYEELQQTDVNSMEEIFSQEGLSDGGSSDHSHSLNQLESEMKYNRCHEPDFGFPNNGFENVNEEANLGDTGKIPSPKGFDEAASSDTRDTVHSRETDVIDLVTPLRCVVRSDKRRTRKMVSGIVDLTSSPCIIEL
ncbi:hypothetical protein LUZ62_034261 [Rhynchospora pubera]|uniref:Structure-specific endonuclease subunit SLX1 homolog n=1 Tax=Rhynchospora pubera TaxID=906938 RepID=A0AAV8HY42_9POAL|nr:hypothetical protein LUZ62_034261 [Rhynchospora pubera]